MDISGFNLLAISNDLAVWYYYSAVNNNGFFRNQIIKIRNKNEIVDRVFEGLWANNAEAINLWFPENLVMTVLATDKKNEFYHLKGRPLGAVASSVVTKLKQKGWQVGLVNNHDDYRDVEPLMPDGTAKNGKVLKIL